ncbi:hypothetical protein L249_1526, partial [Ophiocordyceps polyrhachis-furcata BCC 54312]
YGYDTWHHWLLAGGFSRGILFKLYDAVTSCCDNGRSTIESFYWYIGNMSSLCRIFMPPMHGPLTSRSLAE